MDIQVSRSKPKPILIRLVKGHKGCTNVSCVLVRSLRHVIVPEAECSDQRRLLSYVHVHTVTLLYFPTDPYARLSFLTQSAVTEKVHKSLCPTWDQTLIFEEIEISGDPRVLEESPPEIYVEIFDFDKFVSF